MCNRYLTRPALRDSVRAVALQLRKGEVAITTRVPRELRDRIKIEAIHRQTTMQEAIIQLLEEALSKGRKRARR